MSNIKTVLITGSTGFLGSEILKILLSETENNIFLLIRPKKAESSSLRLKNLLNDLFSNIKLIKNYLKRITILSGDMASESLGLSSGDYSKFVKNVDEIFHSAAALEFNLFYEAAQKINVMGLDQLLNISKNCKKLSKFSYISTAYVAGNYIGEFSEDDFYVGQKFNNFYEQTKYEAEDFFRNFSAPYQKNIFRPSIITGNYASGMTKNFNLIYKPMRVFSSQIFDSIPADVDTNLNLIPGDLAAKIIYILSQINTRDVNTYHITSSHDIKAGDFYDYVAKYFNYENPIFIPIEKFDIDSLTPFQISMIREYLPYFNYKCQFKNLKTIATLSLVSNFNLPNLDCSYFEKICRYCEEVGFLRSKRF